MLRYNAEFKESLLKKVFTRNDGISIHQIALESNVSPTALYSWIKRAKGKVIKLKNHNYNSGEKFEYCLKSFNLDESAKGEYLRSSGLYSYQLDAWRKDFINNNDSLNSKNNNLSKIDKNRIKP